MSKNMDAESKRHNMDKACIKCGIIKPLQEFHRCAANVDGHKNLCKTCKSIESQKYRANMSPAQKYQYAQQTYRKRNR